MEGPAESREAPGILHILQPQTFVHMVMDGDNNSEKQKVFFSCRCCFYERPQFGIQPEMLK